MESLGLSEFLRSVGNAVHSLNTICAGLNGVETRSYTKPDDLTITWDPQDPVSSARKSRLFAINAAVVFVEGALTQYFKYLARHPAAPGNIKCILEIEGNADRIEKIVQGYPPPEDYWAPFIALLIHWRNRIVHPESNARLKGFQERLLLDQKDEIRVAHAKIDVVRLLENFSSRNISLKDASTIIAISIKFLRYVDQQLQVDTSKYENIPYWFKHLNIEKQYADICKSNGSDARRRRLRQFFKTNLPFVEESLIFELEEKPLKIETI
jgi:hypothetical protein